MNNNNNKSTYIDDDGFGDWMAQNEQQMEGLTKKQQKVYDEFARYETAQRPIDICISLLGHSDSAYIYNEITALKKKGKLEIVHDGTYIKYKTIP